MRAGEVGGIGEGIGQPEEPKGGCVGGPSGDNHGNEDAELDGDPGGLRQTEALALARDSKGCRGKTDGVGGSEAVGEVAAVDLTLEQEELRLLEMIRDRLELDRLVTAAIEAAARARYRRA